MCSIVTRGAAHNVARERAANNLGAINILTGVNGEKKSRMRARAFGRELIKFDYRRGI